MAFLLIVKSFIQAWWKEILCAILIALYTYFVYDYGRKTERHDFSDAAYGLIEKTNKGLKGLENLSNDLSVQIDVNGDATNAAVEAVLAKMTKGGGLKPLKDCKDDHLGTDFTDQWSALNRAGQAKYATPTETRAARPAMVMPPPANSSTNKGATK